MKHIAIWLFIMSSLAFGLTIQPVLGETFPAADFNGMQISYSVSGASITSSEDKTGFTTSRTLKGTLGTGNLRVTGTAMMGSGYYADLVVTVWVGSKKESFKANIKSGYPGFNKQDFDVRVPIPEGATSGGFSIDMTGNYNAGERGLIVRGEVSGPPAQITPAPAGRVDSGARFSGISGQVEIRPDNDPNGWKLAKLETIIYEDDHIKTDEDSTAIIGFADMSVFVMKRETEVVVATPPRQDSKLKLVFGNIWVNIKRMFKDGSMEVEMNQAVSGTKGTIFALEETGSTSTLKVADGSVEFTHKVTGETLTIYAGEKVTAGKSGFGSIQRFDAESELAELEREIPGSSRLMERITSTPVTGAIKEIFSNNNIGGVSNNPASPTTFTLDDTYKITMITTYHWNFGSGAPPGTIGLKDSRGNTLGTWTTTTLPGQGGVPNAYWNVAPDIILGPGTYTIVDSDPSTWSQNSESNSKGIAVIKGTKWSGTPTTGITPGVTVKRTTPKPGATTPQETTGDFTVSISPTEMTVNPGENIRFTMTVEPEGGFNEPVEIYVKTEVLGIEKDYGRVKIINPPYKPYVFEKQVPDSIPKGTTITGYVTARGGGLERDAGTVTVNVPGFGMLLAIGALGLVTLLRKRR
ncbi:MAG: FecR family protein [Candidatus Methanoperedens sp.]|nr:FecR family protein [Candidatus Methanoperedens sp.]